MVCDAGLDLLALVEELDAGRAPAELAALRGHAAVREFRRCASARGADETYGVILTALSAPPGLAWRRPPSSLPEGFIARAGGRERLERFLAGLRALASDPRARPWLDARAAGCAGARRVALAELAGRDVVAQAEEYLGLRLDARLTLRLSLAYRPSRFTSYIHPYPYSFDGTVAGPFEVSEVLEPAPVPGPLRFGLEAPFEHESVSELFFLAAEPAYSRHRALFDRAPASGLGCTPGDGRQDCVVPLVVEALNRRAAARFDGRAPPPSEGRETAVERLSRALERDYEPGRREGRYRSIDEFWPRLIAALGPEQRPPGAR